MNLATYDSNHPSVKGHPMTYVKFGAITLAVIALSLVGIRAQGLKAITEVAAPVFLFPDAARTPLVTLPKATRVEVIEQNDQWTKVEFKDTALGPRVGWMKNEQLLLLKIVSGQTGAPVGAVATVIVATAPAPSTPQLPPAAPAPVVPAAIAPVASTPTLPPSPPPASLGLRSRYSPSPAQISSALVVGARQKNKLHGLSLVDSGQVWLAALNSGLNGRNSVGTSTGFSVVVYTPIAWIRQQAARSSKEYRQLTPNEVTDEMRQPVLRVTVNPDTPTMVTASGMVGTSSVQHVVLRDARRLTAVQPFTKEAAVEEVSNAMGGRKVFQGLVATFPMNALDEIRGGSGEDEFLITVIGSTGEEKDFKVKRKHFERLPLQ